MNTLPAITATKDWIFRAQKIDAVRFIHRASSHCSNIFITMDIQLKDKLAIDMGSTGDGIGKATALECALYGAFVVVNGRSEASVEPTVQEIRDKTTAIVTTSLALLQI
jgi:hypothetical protein